MKIFLTPSDILRKQRAEAMLELHFAAWEALDQTQEGITESLSSLDNTLKGKHIDRAELEALRDQLAQISSKLHTFLESVPEMEREQLWRLENFTDYQRRIENY